MNILVTGSSGTIGTRLCEVLLATEHTVYGVDWKENTWHADVQSKTTIADIRNKSALDALPDTIDYIVHLAANARVHELVLHPERALDNMITTFNVLEFARVRGIKKVLFASSRETYGNIGASTYTEDMASIAACESPYTASKIAGEALVESYTRCYGIDHIIFRFSNVYGMYDDSERVIPAYIRQALKNEPLCVYGADKCLDFTYIDDAIHAILQTISVFETAKNTTYNIAYGQGTTITTVAETIAAALGSTSTVEYGAVRTGEVVKYIADISHAKEKLAYSPQYTFPAGMQKAMEWYRAYHGI